MNIKDIVLFGDVFWNEIIKNLNISDLVHLRKVHPIYYIKITKEFIKEKIIYSINQRLTRYFGENKEEFLNLLNKTGSVISGSFIIQCILNEEWESDVDIFIPILNLKERKYTESKNLITELEDFFHYN